MKCFSQCLQWKDKLCFLAPWPIFSIWKCQIAECDLKASLPSPVCSHEGILTILHCSVHSHIVRKNQAIPAFVDETLEALLALNAKAGSAFNTTTEHWLKTSSRSLLQVWLPNAAQEEASEGEKKSSQQVCKFHSSILVLRVCVCVICSKCQTYVCSNFFMVLVSDPHAHKILILKPNT